MLMKLKRVFSVSLIALLAVSFVLPSMKASAYNGGLLEGKSVRVYTDISTYTESNAITDNDSLTSENLYQSNKYKKIVYRFDSPADITSFYYDISIGGAYAYVYFYSDYQDMNKPSFTDENLIGYTQMENSTPKTITVDMKDVMQVVVHSSTPNSSFLKEFDVFGPVVPPDTVPPSTVGSLLGSGTDGMVELSWTNPTDTDFSYVKIMRDGVLLADNVTDNFYIDTDVVNETSYSYTLISYDLSGNESIGRSITVTPTQGDLTAPSEITGLTENVASDSVTFDFVLPTDPDFDRVILYKDGVEYDTTTGTTLSVTGLTESTSYSFKFTTVDIYGNESAGVIRSVSTLETVDLDAPSAPTGLTHIVGNGGITLDWNNNQEADLDGYNVYVDGVKVNATPLRNSYYTLNGLTNSSDYLIAVTAVDKSGNESTNSNIITATPSAEAMPLLTMAGYDLGDVADGVGSWFGALWLIIAFSVAIPLAFYISNRIKLLFLS